MSISPKILVARFRPTISDVFGSKRRLPAYVGSALIILCVLLSAAVPASAQEPPTCNVVPLKVTFDHPPEKPKAEVEAGDFLTGTVTVSPCPNTSSLATSWDPPLALTAGFDSCGPVSFSEEFIFAPGETQQRFAVFTSARTFNDTEVTFAVGSGRLVSANFIIHPAGIGIGSDLTEAIGGTAVHLGLFTAPRAGGIARMISSNPAVASFGGSTFADFPVSSFGTPIFGDGAPGPLQLGTVSQPTTVTINALFSPCEQALNFNSPQFLASSIQITVLPEPIIHRFHMNISTLDGVLLQTVPLRLEDFNGFTRFELDSGDYIGISTGGDGGGQGSGGGPQSQNDLTVDRQTFLLGQGFGIRVVPVQDNGTEGTPVIITESITDAADQSDQSATVITQSATELFSARVLVHFPLSNSVALHQFFPIHSGTSMLNFAFQGLTLKLPVNITNCGAGDCVPQLGTSHPEFDSLFTKLGDRNGIPPQLVKAQVLQESSFNSNAFRYEPLSKDWKEYNAGGTVTVPAALAPWLLAQSDNCSTDPTHVTNVPAGASIVLNSADVAARERLYGVFVLDGTPLCRVTSVPDAPVTRGINSTDAVLSMENILYTNDGCFFKSSCAGWATINARTFNNFTDFQVENPPFTGQTVVASSYGLHQLMYETAVGMGFQENGVGRAPSLLFDPGTSVDLGSQYLAALYVGKGSSQNGDFEDANHFFFQFGPALRTFNGPPKLSFSQIFDVCADSPYAADPANPSGYDYPCLILQHSSRFAPLPLRVN